MTTNDARGEHETIYIK